MQKRGFYVDVNDSIPRTAYRPTLRNLLLNQHLKRTGGVPSDLPDGFWLVTFSWQNSRIIPGLLFTEA